MRPTNNMKLEVQAFIYESQPLITQNPSTYLWPFEKTIKKKQPHLSKTLCNEKSQPQAQLIHQNHEWSVYRHMSGERKTLSEKAAMEQ